MAAVAPACVLGALAAATCAIGAGAAAARASAHRATAAGAAGARSAAAAHHRPRARAAVVGGAAAQPGAFASVAEVLDIRGEEIGECTGTVVAPTLVLTAGHCAENMQTGVANKASGYRVMTGEVAEGGQRQVSTVSGVLVYEGFARSVDDRDAALLVLSTPTTAPAIKLAANSASGGLRAGLTATIAGWGKTTYRQSRPTGELHWAATVVQRGRWCRRNAPPFYEHSEICTIDPPGYATGACNGDSGGPLLAPEASGGGYVQIGIVVHGYQRCSTRRPSVFTRVEAIAPWVQTWIDAYQPSPSTPPAAAPPAAPAPPATPPSPSTPSSPAAPASPAPQS
jgi:secreted trypsin-like serine protease